MSELSRVLSTDGVLFIGFPKRKRLVGYIGASQKMSLLDLIKWNLNDYKYRIKGKFKNEFGAHAGFTQKEFIEDASKYFSDIVTVRQEYMNLKYKKYKRVLKMLNYLKIDEYIFPSNHFICLNKK